MSDSKAQLPVQEPQSRTESTMELEIATKLNLDSTNFRHSATWRYAKFYLNPASQNFKHWAWEFLRRNEQYGKFALWMRTLPIEFRTKRTPSQNDLLEHLFCDPPPPKELLTYGEFKRWCRHQAIKGSTQTPNQVLRLRWGITFPLLPYENFPLRTETNSKSFKRPIFLSSAIVHRLPAWTKEEGLIRTNDLQHFQSSQYSHEVGIKFRLNEPIQRQIERASAFLEKWQRKYLKRVHDPVAEAEAEQSNPIPPSKVQSAKSYAVHEKSLHYMLRIIDAAHDQLGVEAGLSNELIKALVKRFKYERDVEYPRKPPHHISKTYDFPDFTDAQIRNWYDRACHNIVQYGYLAVAAHKPSSQEERDRKKTVAQKRRQSKPVGVQSKT